MGGLHIVVKMEYCCKDIEATLGKEVAEDECTLRDLLEACENACFLLLNGNKS